MSLLERSAVLSAVPIDDAFAVQEEETHSYFCCIEPAGGILFIYSNMFRWLGSEKMQRNNIKPQYSRRMGLFEFTNNLNVEHEIPAVDIFHYVVQTILPGDMIKMCTSYIPLILYLYNKQLYICIVSEFAHNLCLFQIINEISWAFSDVSHSRTSV